MSFWKTNFFVLLIALILSFFTYQIAGLFPNWSFMISFLGGSLTMALIYPIAIRQAIANVEKKRREQK